MYFVYCRGFSLRYEVAFNFYGGSAFCNRNMYDTIHMYIHVLDKCILHDCIIILFRLYTCIENISILQLPPSTCMITYILYISYGN